MILKKYLNDDDKQDKSKHKPKITHEIDARKSRWSDGATSKHIIEKHDTKTNSVTHQVENKNGKIIHQHQTHVRKHGTKIQFNDNWANYPSIGD